MFGDEFVLIAAKKQRQGIASFPTRPPSITICCPDDFDEHGYKPATSMAIWGEAYLTGLRKAIDFALQTPSAPGPSE